MIYKKFCNLIIGIATFCYKHVHFVQPRTGAFAGSRLRFAQWFTSKPLAPTGLWIFFIYCFMMFNSTVVFAQTVFKIGVVDTQKVVNEYKKAKEVDGILRTAVERLRGELKLMDDELRQMQEKLDKQRLFLDDEQKEMQVRNEIRLKQEEMRGRAEKGQEAIDEKRKELGEPIIREIEELIKKIGKEEGFSIILEKGLVTLYVEPKYDLTDRVLKILNDKYDKEHPEQKKETSKEGAGEKKE